MSAPRIGIMRVVSGLDEPLELAHQQLLTPLLKGAKLATRALPNQPEGIHDARTLALALPKIAELGETWQAQLDFLLVSCAADPGIKALRQSLKIPVLGAGESCCKIARQYGQIIGVLGIEAQLPEVFNEQLSDCPLIYRQPDGVNCTHDIRTPKGQNAIIEAALACEQAGAKVIALACTGMATTDVASLLAPHTPLPVINPVLAAGELISQHFDL